MQTRLQIVLAFVSFGYATLITFLNVQRIDRKSVTRSEMACIVFRQPRAPGAGIACAVEQCVLPVLREKIQTSIPKFMAEAILIPSVALILGTSLVVSFASVSVIEWQGLGSASPGEIFTESLIQPAIGLLLGGVGSSLILALFYLLLGIRNRARPKSVSS